MNAEFIVVVTDHKEFKAYDWLKIGKKMRTKVIIDGRQMMEPENAKSLGFIYRGI